jgi:LCP family protein required for cell wall assembly
MSKKEVEKEKPQSPPKEVKLRRLRALFTLKNLLFALIVLLFLVQYFQIQSIASDTSSLFNRDSSLITDVGNLSEGLTEIRQYLGMSNKDYLSSEALETDSTDTDKNEDEVQLALFQYVDYLASEENLDKKLNSNKSYLDAAGSSETFVTFLTEQGLSVSSVSESDENFSVSITTSDSKTLVFAYLSKESGDLFFKTVNSLETVTAKDSTGFVDQLILFIKTNKDDVLKTIESVISKRGEIENAINSEGTQAELLNLGLSLSSVYSEKDLQNVYSVYNKSEDLVGEIIFDTQTLKISLIDKNDVSLSVETSNISTALVPFLQKLNSKTFIEKKVDEALADLTTTFSDEGFKLLLSQAGLTIATESYEYDGRIFYDIFDSDGNKVSSLVVEKATGVINIVDSEGNNSENLLFFDPDFKKKTLEIPDEIPEFDDALSHEDNTFNILISGKHGSLVDTMIFAHIDEETRKIRMISIPRDLYYEGRKINSFPYFYGMPELKRVLSDITGYELDKYILIDMYAFIDVIDLVGGVDIHLDDAVIDPTYRTVDDGVVGTLHYEPGDYHLGGVEALRLARTRHTSSDFARAERQQLILEALQNKARNFGFGDADTIYEIAKTVLSKTETDIGIDEAIVYYFKYQGYEIESNAVMSSGNVLYVPPYTTVENCNEMIAAAAAAGAQKPGCENDNHAYTLLPRNDNWNVVKWFFKENFEGEIEAV